MVLLEPTTNRYDRILSIESNPLSQKKIMEYLEDTGFTLFGAATQEEGLDLFRKEKPDLVLTDSRFNVLDIIQNESPQTPVIITSDQEAISNAVNALRLGAWDYILHPANDLTILERSICKALERTRLVEENRLYRLALEASNENLSQSLRTLEIDQEAGRQVQMQLLPAQVYSFGAYEFQYKIFPSLYLSGDFIDYFQISDTFFGFYIADVSGHGASSAFVTVLLKSLMTQMVEKSIIMQPNIVLKMLSDELIKAKLGKYLTMVYGILDTKNNMLSYSIAGHYPKPILYDGTTGRYLEGEGFAVGIFEQATYENYQLKLPEQFSLSMYSDGVLEILPGQSMEENEEILLKKSSDFSLNSYNLLERFGVQHEDTYIRVPDDIAFLVINKK